MLVSRILLASISRYLKHFSSMIPGGGTEEGICVGCLHQLARRKTNRLVCNHLNFGIVSCCASGELICTAMPGTWNREGQPEGMRLHGG